jgi:hypothetical protein
MSALTLENILSNFREYTSPHALPFAAKILFSLGVLKTNMNFDILSTLSKYPPSDLYNSS